MRNKDGVLKPPVLSAALPCMCKENLSPSFRVEACGEMVFSFFLENSACLDFGLSPADFDLADRPVWGIRCAAKYLSKRLQGFSAVASTATA